MEYFTISRFTYYHKHDDEDDEIDAEALIR